MRQKLKSWLSRDILEANEELVDLALEAIEKANRGEWRDTLVVPKPYTVMGLRETSVRNLVSSMQLRRYLDR